MTCCGQGGKLQREKNTFQDEIEGGQMIFGGNENQQYDIWGETKKF